MRVAIVCYSDDASNGGSLRVAEVIANNFDLRRIEPHLVFAYGGPGPVSRRARVSCHYLGAHGPRDLGAWFRARGTLRRLRPDVIHFMDNVVWIQAASVASGSVKIVHAHGPFLPPDLSYSSKLIWRLTNFITDHYVFITRAARDNFCELGFANKKKSSVVPNSVDCRGFDNLQPKEKARNSLGLPPDILLLGMVCRLVSNKGGTDFLSLMDRLPENWHGVICGDGPERAPLEAQRRKLQLTNRVHFVGKQDDIALVYAALDAYAFLTRYESFGLMIAEAMAARVPVFGFGGDGGYREHPHLLVTPETACLVEHRRPYDNDRPADQEALDKLSGLVIDYGSHPERYRSMIDLAAIWVRACFDAPLQAEAMAEVYEHVCQSGTGEAPEVAGLYEAARTSAFAEMLRIRTKGTETKAKMA